MRLFVLCTILMLIASCAPTRYPDSYQQSTVLHLAEGGIVKRGNAYQVDGQWYYPLATGEAYDEVGIASWYGEKFHGLTTANGETYNMYAMTAAHTTLPMPSLVRVTNLENGKSVTVRVNDRGPFVKKRIIDLSYAAAKALGMIQHGTARVRVQTIKSADVGNEKVKGRPVPVPYPSITMAEPEKARETQKKAYVQIGAFSSEYNAIKMVRRLKQHDKYASAQVMSVGEIYRVRLGPFEATKDAQVMLSHLQASGYTSSMVIHD